MLIDIDKEQALAMIVASSVLSTTYQSEASILYELGNKCMATIVNENIKTEEMERNKEKYKQALDTWANIKGSTLSYFELNKVCDFVNEFGLQWVLEAMEITGEQGKCKLGYTHTILNNWQAEGKGENKAFAKKETDISDLLKKWDD